MKGYSHFCLFLLTLPLTAQVTPPTTFYPGSPPGGIGASCSVTTYGYLTALGQVVTCFSGVWTVGGGGAGATIPSTTDLIKGDGSGNGADSGIVPSAVITNATPCGGNLSGTFPNCNSASTTPGYPPNQPLSGCGIEWTGGLTFTVGACTYTINGITYTSALTNLSLPTADPTNPRIDLIIADVTSVVTVLAGTPAPSPIAPAIDPTTQIALDFGTQVSAGGTSPVNVTSNQIFLNGTEWTQTYTAHIALTTNNPYGSATHSIEATAAVLNNSVKLLDPSSGTVDMSQVNALVFYIRSKAQWPTGASGGTAARSLSVFWQNGATVKGTAVVLKDGVFGFSSSNTTTYQQISIPSSLFGINGIPVTTLVLQVSGVAGSSSIGFYVGDITLQAGVGTTPLPTTLMNFKGTWSSATAYNLNDVVLSGGTGYVALAANTNVAVTTTATWGALAPVSSGGTISGLTTGYLPKAASATSLANSTCDEGITTSATVTCTDPLAGPSFQGTGSNPFVNFPSNGGHTPASGDLWNNAGVLSFDGTVNGGIIQSGGPLGTPSSGVLTNETGLPISTGVSGLGTGVATGLGSTATGTGGPVLTTSPTLVTPVLGAATATSLLASGIVDGEAPVTVTTGSSATLGASTYKSGYTFNQNATAATAITYTLPTAAAGLQYCFANSYNGSAANTGTLEVITSASGQFVVFTDGTLSATGGYVISGGAARDSGCMVGVDSTHWIFYPSSGTWTKH